MYILREAQRNIYTRGDPKPYTVMSYGRLHKAAGANVTIMLCWTSLSTQGVHSIALVRFCICLLHLF